MVKVGWLGCFLSLKLQEDKEGVQIFIENKIIQTMMVLDLRNFFKQVHSKN